MANYNIYVKLDKTRTFVVEIPDEDLMYIDEQDVETIMTNELLRHITWDYEEIEEKEGDV